MAIAVLLGASLSAPRLARANSGQTFLETLGVSIAVGTVFGASTLPFYDQPGKHLVNLAYGASAGAVVGIGALVYQLIVGSSGQDDYGQGSRGKDSPVDAQTDRILGQSRLPTTWVWRGRRISRAELHADPAIA